MQVLLLQDELGLQAGALLSDLRVNDSESTFLRDSGKTI